ncbi:MAG: winged helix DNA-binding domain-containing protein [Streptosporangiaceae bacterium]
MVTWTQVLARRLARHRLTEPGRNIVEVVSEMCGAHAQVLSAAEHSVGLRLESVTRTDVQQALGETGDLVKSFGARGTVHLLAARDLPMWTGALGAIPSSPAPAGMRLTPGQTEEVVAAIGASLLDKPLTADELSDQVIARCGSWAADPVVPAFQGFWPRWRQLIPVAAGRGVLCFGPTKGRTVTYTNPQVEPQDSEVALAELLCRYLHAYGPATPQNFAQWMAAPRAWAVALFASLGDRLEQIEIEDGTAWVVAGDTEFPLMAPGGLLLLPYFDAYTVGSHPRDRVFPGPAADRALAGGQAGNYPVLTIGGTVSGVWHLRRSGKKLAVTVESLVVLDRPQLDELDDQVTRLGQILEGTPSLTLAPVTVGPHA